MTKTPPGSLAFASLLTLPRSAADDGSWLGVAWRLALGVLACLGVSPLFASRAGAQSELPLPEALDGVKVEAVADGLLNGQLVAMAFADDGTLYALVWKRDGEFRQEKQEFELPGGKKVALPRTLRSAKDSLVTLHDGNGDGAYDEVRTVMDDLDLPSGLLPFDGWIYWTSGGQLLRRRPFEPELLEHLWTRAAAKTGPPTEAIADGRWIEQVLVRGLAAAVPFHAGDLALGPDGLVYVSCGSGTSVVQSWDGARATVVRSGAVFRMRPDGSLVEEFARGLARPAGAVNFGPQGEVFVADAGWHENRLLGQRLIHLLERGDYGWLHARPPEDDGNFEAAAMGRPDPFRAAAAGERPGTLAPAGVIEQGQPRACLWYRGTRFPEPVKGSLLIGDRDRGELAAWQPTVEAGLLRLANRTAVLRAEASTFQPQCVVQGPDGAVYVASSGNDLASRIFRLSWGGTDAKPANELAPIDSWKTIAQAGEEELLEMLAGDDGERSIRAAREMVRRARQGDKAAKPIRQKLIEAMFDTTLSEAARVAALLATGQIADDTTREAWSRLLVSEVPVIRRRALEALGNHPPQAAGIIQQYAETIQYALGQERDPLTKRAAHLALGKLAAAGSGTAAEWGFEGTSVTFGPGMSPLVFDGHVRALELAPGAAKELILGNLFVAIDFDVTEFDERQRIKTFVVATAEAMRTRELATFLDALLRGEEDYLAKLESPLEARLIAAYQNVHTAPPINADAVAEWIEKHPGGPPEVELAALETLSLVGTTKPAVREKLATSLLKEPIAAKQVATSLLAGRIDRSLAPQIAAGLRQHAARDAAGELKMLADQIERELPKR